MVFLSFSPCIGNECYDIRDSLGEGAFAQVFKVCVINPDITTDDLDLDEKEQVLKVYNITNI